MLSSGMRLWHPLMCSAYRSKGCQVYLPGAIVTPYACQTALSRGGISGPALEYVKIRAGAIHPHHQIHSLLQPDPSVAMVKGKSTATLFSARPIPRSGVRWRALATSRKNIRVAWCVHAGNVWPVSGCLITTQAIARQTTISEPASLNTNNGTYEKVIKAVQEAIHVARSELCTLVTTMIWRNAKAGEGQGTA